MSQCIILGVELFICALYGLSLASTFILSCSAGFAGEEESCLATSCSPMSVAGKSSASYSLVVCFWVEPKGIWLRLVFVLIGFLPLHSCLF